MGQQLRQALPAGEPPSATDIAVAARQLEPSLDEGAVLALAAAAGADLSALVARLAEEIVRQRAAQ